MSSFTDVSFFYFKLGLKGLSFLDNECWLSGGAGGDDEVGLCRGGEARMWSLVHASYMMCVWFNNVRCRKK